jgi:hypothetical protein
LDQLGVGRSGWDCHLARPIESRRRCRNRRGVRAGARTYLEPDEVWGHGRLEAVAGLKC